MGGDAAMRAECTATTDLATGTKRFREFVARSEALLGTAGTQDPSTAFRVFIQRAAPLLVEPISNALENLRPRVAMLRPWITPHDLLAVAGLAYAEDPYTELIAWALAPSTHRPSAERRQRSWLESLPLRTPIAFPSPAEPLTQLATVNGVPDLVLQYDEFVVVVEAKTGSSEHDTPGRTPQTLAYPQAVASTFGLPSDTPVHIVFLTPDRRAATNPEAVRASYVDLVVALAGALEPDELLDDLRSAFKMLFTHFLLHAAPLGYDSRPLLLDPPAWLASNVEPGVMLSHLAAIHDTIAVFLPLEP
jgi:PD-(D/E)XK nuclease superfamily protein